MLKYQSNARHPDFGAVLDGLEQAILIFDADDRLILDNVAARRLLRASIVRLRADGWPAVPSVFAMARTNHDLTLDDIRARALRQISPVHFEMTLDGETLRCAATAIYGSHEQIATMLVIDHPDWNSTANTLARFHEETSRLVESAQGHAGLIQKVLAAAGLDTDIAALQSRALGFAEAVTGHLRHLTLLTEAFQRLYTVRSGQLLRTIAPQFQTFELAGFVEDMVEDIDAILLLDPVHAAHDVRSRLRVRLPSNLYLSGHKPLLTRILRDILRNSIMYSPADTPITLRASRQGQHVQIDVTDTGYGIRASEYDRVFAPFQRATQPHVLAETGYGLSLHLAQAELETVGGTIWFTSQEKLGTTVSFTVPAMPGEPD